MDNHVTFTSLLLLRASARWLALPRAERGALARRHAAPVFTRFHGRVELRWVDVEAFSARCSDVLLCKTSSALDQHALMEALRDTPLFGEGYFEAVDLLFGIEDGYRWYEEQST